MSRGFRTLLATIDAGFESLGPAIGAGAFQLLRPYGCRKFVGGSFGMDTVYFPSYEKGYLDAWAAVIGRLEAEAARLQAHGVVGVTLKEEWLAGSPPALQLQLIGTAVRVRGGGALARPFLSMLSLEQTLKLLLGGWTPCGIAVGVGAVHVHSWAASAFWQGSSMQNAELTAPTAGMQLARERAQRGFEVGTRSRRADGAVQSRIDVSPRPGPCGNGQGLDVESRMVGTAVVRFGAPVVPLEAAIDLTGSR